MWEALTTWLQGVAEQYGVDPVVYGIIYVGAAPLFFGSVAWLVRSIRRHHPVALPLLSTAAFFSAPTLYVFIAGRNLPVWVYALLVALAVVGIVVTARKVRARVQRAVP